MNGTRYNLHSKVIHTLSQKIDKDRYTVCFPGDTDNLLKICPPNSTNYIYGYGTPTS
jgi:hypothetical protein